MTSFLTDIQKFLDPPLRGRGFDSQPEGLGVAFFATAGPGLGLVMYIITTLEFPKHNLIDFHLLTMSVNAKILLLVYLYTSPVLPSH